MPSKPAPSKARKVHKPPPPSQAQAQPPPPPPPPLSNLHSSEQISTPVSTPPPPPTPPPTKPRTLSPTPLASLSFKQLNASAVNSLSRQAHPSRPPPRISDGGLPRGYQAAARRYTAVMVALPIAIVTSWVLWDRLVLGQERKKVPEPKGKEDMGDGGEKGM